MKITQAFSKKGGSLVTDIVTGAARFTVSEEGVIADSRTKLEWIAGPDRDTNYAEAEQWVANCNVAGGNWRMPTVQELATLYQKGIGEQNMDPAFRTTGWWVWAEPRDSSSAWDFYFLGGKESWGSRGFSYGYRVFGMRFMRRVSLGSVKSLLVPGFTLVAAYIRKTCFICCCVLPKPNDGFLSLSKLVICRATYLIAQVLLSYYNRPLSEFWRYSGLLADEICGDAIK